MERRIESVLITAAAAVLWGTSFPLIKFVLETQPPALFLLIRFIFATMFFVLASRFSGRSLKFGIVPLSAGVLLAASFILQYVGQVYLTASEAAILLNSSPIIVPIVALAMIKEKSTLNGYISVPIGFGGVILLSDAFHAGPASLTGLLVMLMAALTVSVYVVFTKKYVGTVNALDYYPGAFIGATAVIFIYSIPSLPQPELSLQSILASLYLAVAASFIPFLLWFKGLRNLTATESTVISLIEPAVAIVLSWIFLGETLDGLQIAGAALILLSVFITSL